MTTIMTTEEVAREFNVLAQQEKWFEIHDKLFADNVRSIEPANSPYMPNAEGKSQVRKKADDFVKRGRNISQWPYYRTACDWESLYRGKI